VVDIFPRLKCCGYWGDMTRTFVKGRPAPEMKRAYEAVKEARDFSKSVIRAGALPSEIYKSAMNILGKRGFQTGRNERGSYGFFHSLGHGLGLDIHEEPRLSPKNCAPLESGNVVTVEPGLYYPEWGGIRLEDTVVVRKDSAETITSFPTSFEVE
jgi:Xaa-Pro aminopeptidase